MGRNSHERVRPRPYPLKTRRDLSEIAGHDTDQFPPTRSLRQFGNRHVIEVQQPAGCMIHTRERKLIANLSLQEALFRQSELILRVQHKEDRLRTEFILALLEIGRA